ncbi:MAG: hypothetical protein IKZ50_03740 [Bacteroidales bacterium]|nr:hypothetical protein [Bacteroidales bacterium]
MKTNYYIMFILFFVLSLVTALPSSAQETPDEPIEALVLINVPMPVEKLNEQYTSTLYYSLPYAGGTVTFAAFYDPVDPHTGLTDLEYLNNCLAYAHADTLMTFTSASTNLGQTWWDFTLQILPNNNTFDPNRPTKAAYREIHLTFPLSTGSNLVISILQEKGADRPEVFPTWPDDRIPIEEPSINHNPSALQENETLSNWIRKATYIGENPYTPTDSIVDIVFYNGLGQPKQAVQVEASAVSGKNIIINSQYDPMGKMLREYLPYVSTSASESYDTDAANKQIAYYKGLYGQDEAHPYSEKVPEAATDRILKQFSQGTIFRNQGRFLANSYELNHISDSIPMLMAENGIIYNRGFYGGGELFKTITTDPDGKAVAAFTDENERTILVRSYLGGSADTSYTAGWSDLVYVYDKKNQIAAVITPEGEKERNRNLSQISTDSEWARKRCYLYRYDALGRMTSRRWPARGEELLVVDPAGRVVATQDSLLRENGRWILTRYDLTAKPIETLLTQQSISESNMRSYFSYQTAQTYFNQGGTAPFCPAVYSLSDNIPLSYSQRGKTALQAVIPTNINNQSITLSFSPESETVTAADVVTDAVGALLWEKNAMTATADGKLLGVAEKDSTAKTVTQSEVLYRYTAYFYDCWRRPVQTVTKYPDGSILRASTKYNFQGMPIRQVVRMTVPEGNSLGVISASQTDSLNAVLTEIFSYDDRGRMLASNSNIITFMTLQQGGNIVYSDTLTAASNAVFTYDELGHLVGKTLGSAFSQEFTYNIQDWMTEVKTKKGTANIFNQKLRYYNPQKNYTTPLFGGNISEWETTQGTEESNTYVFAFDKLGRLNAANRFEGNDAVQDISYTEKEITYDRNGNILTLLRVSESAMNAMNDFSFAYDGDKLASISGSKEGTAVSATYTYDGNGNNLFEGLEQVRLSYGLNNQVFRVRKSGMGPFVPKSKDGKEEERGPKPPVPLTEEIIGTYSYFADGAKFSLTDANGLTRIYLGPFTLARKKTGTGTGSASVTLMESAEAQGAEARFAFAATPQTTLGTDTTYTVDYETLYLVKDHLGSVRVITDSMGNVLERNDNYPYGLRTDLGRNYPTLPEKYRVRLPSSTSAFSTDYISETSPTAAVQPYKLLYNGKELQLMAQTPLIDYGARQYNPVTTRWNAPDPLCEKDMNHSPYSYCKNSPIVLVDLLGLTDYYNLNGILVRHIDDNSSDKYLLLTYKGKIINKNGTVLEKDKDFIDEVIRNNYMIKNPTIKDIERMKECYENYMESGNESGYIHGSQGTITDSFSGSSEEISSTTINKYEEKLLKSEEIEYLAHTHKKIPDESEVGTRSDVPSEQDISFAKGSNKIHIILGYYYERAITINGEVSFGKAKGRNVQSVGFFNSASKKEKPFLIDGVENHIKFSDFSRIVKRMNK